MSESDSKVVDTSVADTSLFKSRYCPVTRPSTAMSGYLELRYAPRPPRPNVVDTSGKSP